MRLFRFVTLVAIVVAVTLLLATAPAAYSAPSADGTLNNPSFEGEFIHSTVYPEWFGVPVGWTPWYVEGGAVNCGAADEQPYKIVHLEGEQHPTHVKDGVWSARVWVGFAVSNGGLYQSVAVTPGTTYQFSAWALLWSVDLASGGVDSESTSVMSFQVGIDPTGGTSGNSSTVKWSGGTQTMDTFTQQSVQATATGSTITVFLREQSYWCVYRNDAFFDSTSLSVVSTGPPPTAPGSKPPTPTIPKNWGASPGTIRTATPQPDGSIIHTVGPGESCIGIALAYGVDFEEFKKLNNLTNATCRFIYVGQKLIIKPAGSAPPGGGQATATPTGGTPEPPAITPTSQQVAEASKTGTICVMGYTDGNGNGIREPTEQKLAGMTFTVNGATGPVANYTTDGVAEPHCFAQLQPGGYTVAWTGSGMTATGEQSWVVNLTAGSTASHEFGAKTDGSNPTTGGGTDGGGGGGSGEGLPTWAIALIAAFGVILFMGGLGVAGYFFVLRRTSI